MPAVQFGYCVVFVSCIFVAGISIDMESYTFYPSLPDFENTSTNVNNQ